MSRIKKTLLAVFLGRGVMAVRQLVMVPLLIGTWGVDYFGNWLVISAIPSFLAMSNLGLGSSAAATIATRPQGSDNENALTLMTAMKMIAGVMFLVLLGIWIWWIFRGNSDFGLPDGTLILVCLVLSIFLRMLSQPLQGWWNSEGRAYQAINAYQVLFSVELGIYILVPLLGGKALILSVISCGWTFVWAVAYFIYAKNQGCRLFRLGSFNRQEVRLLLSMGMGHQLNPLWQGLLFQGSIIVAKSLFGPAGAALWGSLRIINRSGNQLVELVTQTCRPEFQRNHASGDLEANKRLHCKGILISLALSLVMAFSLILIGPWVFKLWTHGKFSEPLGVWFILPISLIPFSVWRVSGEYQLSINRPWYLNMIGCIAALSSLVLSWVLYSFESIGILNMCFGFLFFELVMCTLIPKKSFQWMKLEAMDTFSLFRIEMVNLKKLFHRGKQGVEINCKTL